MAFFKFRTGSDDAAPAAAQAESVEVMRRRAKHRLIGAALLVLVGVIGFPLVFDNQPRPVSVDIPIEIPDRAKVRPLVIPAPILVQPVAQEPVPAVSASAPVTEVSAPMAPPPPAAVTASASPMPAAGPALTKAAPVASVAVPKPAAAASAAVAKAAPMEKAAATEKPASTPKADDGAKARALLEGKEAPAAAAASAAGTATAASTPAGEPRFVVQVGAFADEARAREVRLKLERAGMKTYVHVAETKEGKRTRVRVGPFADKAEAQRVAERVKALDLSAVVLTL